MLSWQRGLLRRFCESTETCDDPAEGPVLHIAKKIRLAKGKTENPQRNWQYEPPDRKLSINVLGVTSVLLAIRPGDLLSTKLRTTVRLWREERRLDRRRGDTVGACGGRRSTGSDTFNLHETTHKYN